MGATVIGPSSLSDFYFEEVFATSTTLTPGAMHLQERFLRW